MPNTHQPPGNFEGVNPGDFEGLRQELIIMRDEFHKRLVAGSL